MTPSTNWTLAIDFGTSFTVAAVKHDGRAPEAIDIGGERRMPTVVHIDDAGTMLVGRVADDLASARPGQTLRAPKRRLGDPSPVVLGGRPYQVVDLVAAVLRHVCDEAMRHQGSPPIAVRLTHPATWSRPRLARLLEAAAKAGLPDPMLIPEPVAAAMAYASEVAIPDGAHVAVYDLGGGTFDTTVLRAHNGAFSVVGRPGGDANLGGELFDELLINVIGERLEPAVWEQLQVSDDLSWRQAAAALRSEVRRAKEALTAAPYAELLIPLPGGLVNERLTREELESIVAPHVEESVRLLLQCVRDAGVDPQSLAAVYLVGGASRMPIIDRSISAALGTVPVSRRGDPKTAVALGATLAEPTGSVLDLQAAGGRDTLESDPGRLAPMPPPAIADPLSQAPDAPAATSKLTVTPPDARPTTLEGTELESALGTVVERDAPPPMSPPPTPSGPALPPLASAPAPAPPPSRRPRQGAIAAAAAAAVLVIGGGAFALTRGNDKTTTSTTSSPVTAAPVQGRGITLTSPVTTSGGGTGTKQTTSPSVTSSATTPPTRVTPPPTGTPTSPSTAAPTTTPTLLALNTDQLAATVLTLDEVANETGLTDWQAGTFVPSDTPFCGVAAPDEQGAAHTVADRGSGSQRGEVITTALTYATIDDLNANYDALIQAARECPDPKLVNQGVTYAITTQQPVERKLPLVDRGAVFSFTVAAPGGSIAINNIVGVITKGRSAVLLTYSLLGRTFDENDQTAAAKLLTAMAGKLIAPPS